MGSSRKNSSRVQESFLKDLLLKLSTFRGTDQRSSEFLKRGDFCLLSYTDVNSGHPFRIEALNEFNHSRPWKD